MNMDFPAIRRVYTMLAKAPLIATALVALSSNASALSFNFTFTPTSTAQDIAGFTAAGAFWSSQFTDSVTINMNVGTAALATNILAEAGSTQGTLSYTNFRSVLNADKTSSTDNAAVSSLATGSSFGMLLNRTSNNPNVSGSATSYLDNDGDADLVLHVVDGSHPDPEGQLAAVRAVFADIEAIGTESTPEPLLVIAEVDVTRPVVVSQ